MLSPYRVLDLADEKGVLCGRILADLGADVIKVEPPGGDPSRNIGPFYKDIPHPEKSLFWFAYNAGKRSITLNLRSSDGAHLFKRLAQAAHFVIESFAPGYMEGLGLGYAALKEVSPHLILTSITPFGQDGPYKGYKGGDLEAMAAGGWMHLTGDPERPPVRISFPQAPFQAGSDAAAGTLIAHHHRQLTGEGQHVDISMQESVVWNMMNASLFWDLNRIMLRRAGHLRPGLSVEEARQQQTWPCRDGYVCFMVRGGGMGKFTQAMVDWMKSEGVEDEFLSSIPWDGYDMSQADQEFHDRVAEPILRFFAQHTKEELYQGAIERRITLYPVSTVKDVRDSPQLAARDFWVKIEHPELGTTLDYPGPPLKASQSRLGVRRRAPFIGEHNEEIYCGELGLSQGELGLLKAGGII